MATGLAAPQEAEKKQAPEPLHPLLDGDNDVPIEDAPVSDYFVLKQEVRLEVDFTRRRIHGTTDLFVAIFNDKVEEIAIDAAQCDIDGSNIAICELRESQGDLVEGQKRKATVEYNDPYEHLTSRQGWNWSAEHHDLRRIRARDVFHSRRVDVAAENREFEGCTPAYGSLKVNLRKGEQDRPRLIIRKTATNLEAGTPTGHKQYRISVPFSTKQPRDGIHFVGVDNLDGRFTHMYTRHSTHPGTASCIFPCIDDHGSRCDWKISIKYPKTLGDAHKLAQLGQDDKDREMSDGGVQLAEEDKLREMTAVCSGFLMEEVTDPTDDHKKIMTFEPEKKCSVQKLGFAVGPFEHVDLSSEFRTEEDEVKLGLSALKVHAYCLPNRADLVRNTAMALTMAADFFTYTFAKYPFGNFKICFLDDMVEDSTSIQSMAFISNRLLFPEDVIDLDVEVTRTLILSLAWQWIGINMLPNTRNDLWLVFGIAHYMTELFMKKLCGNNEHRFRMKTMSDRLVEADKQRLSLYDLGPYLHIGGYEMEFMNLKAAVVMYILDKRLHKASGGMGLNRILQKLFTKAQIEGSDKSTIMHTERFRTTCEKAARYNLESFWNQWIYGAGCPNFDVKAKFNKKQIQVEVYLTQLQTQSAKKAPLEADDFLRLIKERRADLDSAPVQPLFTGPLTIRIHEADGTPYEHIVELREDAGRQTKFPIGYNTKYKRLKRTRKQREKNQKEDGNQENTDDALLYCLGDVLMSQEETEAWELKEWDDATVKKMNDESYEWIRVDTDFEWAAGMNHTLEPYMYVSQLQQDRDVVAHQDALLYLSSGPLHPIASSYLVRTLVDKRYYYGIRTMAAAALTRQSNIKHLPGLGLRQLMKAFRELFCYENSNQPKPNDFTDKSQYRVRGAIIKAIAEVRDENTNMCPLEARQFILDQLLFNNNEDNPYSDHHYIALLVEALARSLIPSKEGSWLANLSKEAAQAERHFLDQALEQIERVLRRDEWTNSYRNIWTTAGLDAKRRLMRAEIIPVNYSEFGAYLIDGTADEIRIKCFEALVDLGAMMDSAMFSFLLYVIATDRSPYVRHKLIHLVTKGLAVIAFGQHFKPSKKTSFEDADSESEAEFEIDNGGEDGLQINDVDKIMNARKHNIERKEDLNVALNALRKAMESTFKPDERHYSTAMRKTLDSRSLGRAEVEDLLFIAAMMFEEAKSWILTLSMPKGWKVRRATSSSTKQVRGFEVDDVLRRVTNRIAAYDDLQVSLSMATQGTSTSKARDCAAASRCTGSCGPAAKCS